MFLFSVFSCQYFDKKVPNEKELLEKQLKEINWNEVDEYPSINDCEKLEGKELRKQCFFEFLATTIQQKLSSESKNLFANADSINVKVTVNANSTIDFETQSSNDSIAYNYKKIDSIIKSKFVDFPKINPAIKHGIPVKTEFILPIVLKQK